MVKDIKEATRLTNGCRALSQVDILKRKDPGWKYDVRQLRRSFWVIIILDQEGNVVGYY
jgi:hypothetical protein